MKQHNNKQNTLQYRGSIGLMIMSVVVLLFSSCNTSPTPRPEGFFRIDAYPESYSAMTIGNINVDVNDSAQHCFPTHNAGEDVVWLNLVYPRYNATIYLSYIPLNNNLDCLIAESIELVYRQNINTEMVEAIAYENVENKVYATLYALSSESATPIQFLATDSTQFLLRGALYYNTPVKSDSVAPTLQYLENDIIQLIESITPAQE